MSIRRGYKVSKKDVKTLCNRLKERFGEENITRVVSDKNGNIINAVKEELPNAVHSFCVFHDIDNITKIYLSIYKCIGDLPEEDKEFRGLAIRYFLNSDKDKITTLFIKAANIVDTLSDASKKVFKFMSGAYKNLKRCLEVGLKPTTNNVMEQIFSTLNPFIFVTSLFRSVNRAS